MTRQCAAAPADQLFNAARRLTVQASSLPPAMHDLCPMPQAGDGELQGQLLLTSGRLGDAQHCAAQLCFRCTCSKPWAFAWQHRRCQAHRCRHCWAAWAMCSGGTAQRCLHRSCSEPWPCAGTNPAARRTAAATSGLRPGRCASAGRPAAADWRSASASTSAEHWLVFQ